MKPTPISEVLRRIRPLSREHKMAHLRGIIASEQGYSDGKPNIYRTSVRIRELQAALKSIVNQQLKKESRAA
jgi:hypothetical protein